MRRIGNYVGPGAGNSLEEMPRLPGVVRVARPPQMPGGTLTDKRSGWSAADIRAAVNRLPKFGLEDSKPQEEPLSGYFEQAVYMLLDLDVPVKVVIAQTKAPTWRVYAIHKAW